MIRSARLWIAWVVVLLGGGVMAQSPRPEDSAAALEASAFARGTWCAQSYLSYASDVTNRDVRLAAATAGFGYYFMDNLALNLEGSAFSVDEPGPDGWAGSLGLLLRHHLAQVDRISFYIDVGVGAFEADRDVPPGGTRFNIYTRVGPGVSYRLEENLYVIGGARFAHLSNAKMEGEERNPSLNGIEGYVGLMLTF